MDDRLPPESGLCRLHQPGPFLGADDQRRNYVGQVHADYMTGVLDQLRRLRDQR